MGLNAVIVVGWVDSDERVSILVTLCKFHLVITILHIGVLSILVKHCLQDCFVLSCCLINLQILILTYFSKRSQLKI